MKVSVSQIHRTLKRHRRALVAQLVSLFRRTRKPPRFSRLEARDVRRVLVVRPVHSLGNLLGLTVLLTDLEGAFPRAKVELVTASTVASELYRNFPQVDRALELPRHAFRHPIRFTRALSTLRGECFDLVINPSPRSNFGRFISSLPHASWVMDGDDPSGTCRTTHFAKAPAQRLRERLPATGPGAGSRIPPLDLRLSAAESQWGAAELQRLLGPAPPRTSPTVALFAAGTAQKRIDPAWWGNFLELMRQRQLTCRFVEILPLDGRSGLAHPIPAFHSTHIRETGAVIAACDAFVGIDSGIMHLASAAGVPTVGLFALADPETWHPFGAAECVALRADDPAKLAERACAALARLLGTGARQRAQGPRGHPEQGIPGHTGAGSNPGTLA